MPPADTRYSLDQSFLKCSSKCSTLCLHVQQGVAHTPAHSTESAAVLLPVSCGFILLTPHHHHHHHHHRHRGSLAPDSQSLVGTSPPPQPSPDSAALSLGFNQVEIGNRGLWGWQGSGCRVEWNNCSDKGLMRSRL